MLSNLGVTGTWWEETPQLYGVAFYVNSIKRQQFSHWSSPYCFYQVYPDLMKNLQIKGNPLCGVSTATVVPGGVLEGRGVCSWKSRVPELQWDGTLSSSTTRSVLHLRNISMSVSSNGRLRSRTLLHTLSHLPTPNSLFIFPSDPQHWGRASWSSCLVSFSPASGNVLRSNQQCEQLCSFLILLHRSCHQ